MEKHVHMTLFPSIGTKINFDQITVATPTIVGDGSIMSKPMKTFKFNYPITKLFNNECYFPHL